MVAQEEVQFVMRKRGLHHDVCDDVMMRILVAAKVNMIKMPYSAVSAVASDQPRHFHTLLAPVGAPDSSGDAVGALGGRDQLGLSLHFHP